MAVWYLDNDDEITDAVARLRGTTDHRVVFVVPSGSRIATGRLNFKLLAREAATRDLEMAVASPDEQVRALALAAGVLGLASVEEAEAALERGDAAPQPEAAGSRPPDTEDPEVAAAAVAATAAAAARSRNRRVSVAVFVVLALVVLGGALSLESITTAEITLQPRSDTVGPFGVAVTALTSAAELDVARGVVPAVLIPIPLTVSGAFESSGREAIASRASGEVSFSASEQSFDQDIVAGTRVRTPSGVEFQTTAAVVLPRAAGAGGSSTVTAPIEAIEAGPDGNVAAQTISVVPSLDSQGIGVINPEPTSGGRLEETPIVTRGDYDAATVDLQNRLAGAMAGRLRDSDIIPEGLTLYPETARLGPTMHAPSAADVVGLPLAAFDLEASAVAEVVGVDADQVEAIVTAAVLAEVPRGMTLVPGSVRIESEGGIAAGQRITFANTASGDVLVLVDADAVLAQVAGLPVSEARAILEQFGTTTVNVWPEFLGNLPSALDRISLDVQAASGTE